ncbi:ATP-binding protein [Novosphingobium mangrovi (ex Huang et al. 2023)]|uniref:histidine kinase n=1 Tax=Novosphingobium mangrovi (ex Huang et al. 2023) TaxID=2976432 RepID=A0ABT2I972_9SPHN|nr:ATP-binding protein [Novosphingobium mangrovi (ex Huang et al. 2023)]MCT2401387.1 ATP-binding protein [Novosphingobium mangrovi (ex Huang et al. 2023)]
MAGTLFRRNVTLMVGVVLAGQVVAGLLVLAFVIRPQIDRVANVSADMIVALSQVMEEMPEQRRAQLIARLERGGDVLVRENEAEPEGRPRFPNFIERQFIRAMSSRLSSHPELVWRTGDENRLWFHLQLGGRETWISVTPPTRRSAIMSLFYALAVAFFVAVACGLLLQRRLDAPLRRLAAEVDAYGPDDAKKAQVPPALDTSGPEEVAAVARALNRLTERLARDEAERSLMLGGVSHDLRTPLTRLRLCLEMMNVDDAELETTAARQVDRIEAMLEQFLDYARGFENEPVSPCDVRALLLAVASDHAGEEAIAVDAPDGLRIPLRRDAVGRALGNLVGNALRHGAPPVALSARQTGTALEIVVSDAGKGFDARTAAQLVRPFARGNSSRGGDGAGLGLAIAERVAAAHGGTLSFETRAERFCAVLRLPDRSGVSGKSQAVATR